MTTDAVVPAPTPVAPRPRQRRLGPLGRRLLVAFLAVALSSVVVLAVLALVGADRGLAAAEQAAREQTATQAAAAAATAYERAGGWTGADLSDAAAVATAAGAGLLVRDASGQVVATSTGHGGMGPGSGNGGMGNGGMGNGGTGPGSGSGSMGPGSGNGGMGPGGANATLDDAAAAGRGFVTAPVIVGGTEVGSVRLGFGAPVSTAGRGIAWSWILVASLVAIGIAVLMAWYVTRRLTAPLTELTATARRFAAGDRSARAHVTAPGELGDLARTFDAAADAVERSERTRRNLAADVAHELRTPLTALQAGLEELRDGLVPADEAVLAGLHDQSVRLGRIVQDLATLSAAEAPTLASVGAPVDLSAVVASAAAGRAAELRAADVELRTDLSPEVLVTGDADRLDQIVGNLLANVARHCRPGDTVTVGTRAADGYGVLSVVDTGPGIRPEDLPHAFERFWRGPGTQDVSGSGIGLAVVRALTEAQGGQVTLASDGRSGTSVTVRIPAAAAAVPPGV